MRTLLVPAFVIMAGATAHARTINIAPGNATGYTDMEAAVAGDEIVIAPGVYRYRVNFDTAGSAAAPIVIRAADPADRPIFDPTPNLVAAAPGSYNGGDKGRGCFQFRGAHYRVDGIVFRNCIDHGSAGVRVVNVDDIQVRNCRFDHDTNGMTGAGDGIVIEHSEFDHSGAALAGDNAAHAIYIFGGTLTVRYSYFHDSPLGQDFHVRARDALLAYNWFTRPGSYMGDIMSCELFCGGTGTAGITQRMTLLGNVIVQGTPANHSQLIALYNDEPTGSQDGTGSVNRMDLTLIANTIVGQAAVNNAVVHALNDSGIATAVHASNNVVISFKTFHNPENPALTNFTLDGAKNWMTTATAGTSGVTGTITGADPMLGAAYVPSAGSPVLGAAAALGSAAPQFEYYRDETVFAEGRARATAADLGAFEHGNTAAPFGPGAGPGPTVDAGIPGGDGAVTRDGAAVTDGSAATDGTSSGDGGSGGGSSGCGCRSSGAAAHAPLWLLLPAALLLRRRRAT